jgi:hypothetical protein
LAEKGIKNLVHLGHLAGGMFFLAETLIFGKQKAEQEQ